jgi:hypothetical protein
VIFHPSQEQSLTFAAIHRSVSVRIQMDLFCNRRVLKFPHEIRKFGEVQQYVFCRVVKLQPYGVAKESSLASPITRVRIARSTTQ